MKKGCIFRSVVYLIIVTAVIIYLVDKYGKPVYESSKNKLEQVFIEQLESQILKTASESISDSLKNSFEKKVKEIRSSDNILDTNKINTLVGEIKYYLESQSKDLKDISKLKEIILDYEQRKKD